MVKFIYRFKSFIIVLCIVCFLPLSYLNTKYVYADDITNEAIALASGGVIAPEVAPIIIVAAIGLLGYSVVQSHKDDLFNFLFTTLGASFFETYCHIYQDSSGATYAGIDSSGLDELQSTLNTWSTNNSYFPVTSNPTSDSSTVSDSDSFEDNGYYMTPFKVATAYPHVYLQFKASAGDVIHAQFYNSGWANTKGLYTYNVVQDTYFRFVQTSGTQCVFQMSYDGSSWTSEHPDSGAYSCYTYSNSTEYIGYYTVSNTVSVPVDSVLTGTGIDGSASDKAGSGVVAVPISGQYDSSKGDTVYASIDGSTNASLVNGLSVKTGTNTGTGSGTGTGTDATFWSELWDWLEKIYKGIIDIPAAIGALPGEIVTSIESALSYTFIPTATDFSDFNDGLQDDVKAKFPYSIDILKSLEVGADEFTDIHVNIWGHDCIIVSAQFVNDNISWIRIVTSCFWLFLLVVYIWRKINAVLGGGDINSTTVYAPTGGGSGPPSVM